MFGWLKRRRRQRLMAMPFSPTWLGYLHRNVRQYRLLSAAEQARLRERVQVFVAEKHWIGCGGLAIDDEMRVTIAAQACLLVLGIDYEYHYDRVKSVLVYPGTYLHPPSMYFGLGDEGYQIYGEAWHRGPVVLSWSNARASYQPGGNLVFHEFAHHLDDLDGGMDGLPPLEPADERRWQVVIEREYRRLARDSAAGRATLLDKYGASSHAEFFAVATEHFFEAPIALAGRHPKLYGVLRGFYRQDPARWPWHELGPADNDQQSADATKSPAPASDERGASTAEGVAHSRDSVWQPRCADGLFTRAVLFANARHYKEAEADLTEAIRLTPDDAELYLERAVVRLRLGLTAKAIGDAEQALRLDPAEEAAYRIFDDGRLSDR